MTKRMVRKSIPTVLYLQVLLVVMGQKLTQMLRAEIL